MTFCEYNLSNLSRHYRKVRSGKLSALLGVTHVADAKLWEAIQTSGITFYTIAADGSPQPVAAATILDRVLKERGDE